MLGWLLENSTNIMLKLYHVVLIQPAVPPKQVGSLNATWKAISLLTKEFRQAEGQTAEEHHMIPRQVVKALKGFVSQDALTVSGRTGSVTQREELKPTNSTTPIPGTLQAVLQYFRQQLKLSSACELHIWNSCLFPKQKFSDMVDVCSW